MSTEVVKIPERGRYEIQVDGALAGLADYHEDGAGSVVLPHTWVDPELRGQGLAGTLIRFALDDIVGRGQKVVPACPYVATYIERHPEYREAVAAT